jgi:hypothetical protein
MRTPAGKECRYFYGDYFRGKNTEECRLLEESNPPQPWKPALCQTCPVPEILLANGCKHMILEGKIYRPFFIGKPAVKIQAYCTKTNRSVAEPHIGCGECHPLPFVFVGEETPHDPDPAV